MVTLAIRRQDTLTQRGQSCPQVKNNSICEHHHRTAKRRKLVDPTEGFRRESSPEIAIGCDFFDALPEDLVISILSRLCSSASCPADFVTVLMTCKRLKSLAINPLVLSKASLQVLAFKPNKWSDSAHRFLELCADSGNVQACYTLGMIRFYCLQNRSSGLSLIKAASSSHAEALYSLAVIRFNGSGGSKNDKNPKAGAVLCARAACLGHLDALRELGHCLQDGYGVKRSLEKGRCLLVQANVRELAKHLHHHHATTTVCGYCRYLLLSDFGCNVPVPKAHPANQFLMDWFGGPGRDLGLGLRMCSYLSCGRPETRRHEFRRCSVCGAVNYCSRACQARDWRLRHKTECMPTVEMLLENGDDGGIDVDFN